MKAEIKPQEELAYDAGYRACCHNNGIPCVEVRRSWKDMIRFQIEVSDKTMEAVGIDIIANDIAHRFVEEYKKLRAMENQTDRPQRPAECRHNGDGKCYAPKTIQIIGRCAPCPLRGAGLAICPDFAPKKAAISNSRRNR